VVVPNGQAFFLGLTQGMGNLAIPSVRSPNFVTGVSGWQISKNGNAEFNNVTIRGGTVIGGAALYYSGMPALGNLIASISGTTGVDAFGNTYPAGVSSVVIDLFAAEFTSGAVLESAGTGVQLLNGPLQSVAGSAAHPTLVTTDVWHTLGTVTGTNCAFQNARYRLTPDNQVEIDIAAIVSAGGSTAGTYTFSVTLPAQYTPLGSNLRVYPFAFNAPITTATQDSVLIIDGATAAVPGRVRITIPAVAANVFYTATQRIPLD
jgi:hypothetical protein